MTELVIADTAQRRDLVLFSDRLARLDPSAVVRLRVRADGMVDAWARTPFEVLACRVVRADLSPPDVTCSARELSLGEPGPPMDFAWRGALPPESGFTHVDDVPAAVLVSLQESQALEVSDGTTTVTVPMRCAQALTALGFLPDPLTPHEMVRVRATPAWLRVDARFGSVFLRQKFELTIDAAAISK